MADKRIARQGNLPAGFALRSVCSSVSSISSWSIVTLPAASVALLSASPEEDFRLDFPVLVGV